MMSATLCALVRSASGAGAGARGGMATVEGYRLCRGGGVAAVTQEEEGWTRGRRSVHVAWD